MVTYTSAFLAAANLLAVAQAAPAWQSCQVVVEVIEGPGIWVPAADPSAAWSSWDPKATSSSASWSSWDPKSPKATTTTTSTWVGWTSAAASSTTSPAGQKGHSWSHSTSSSTTSTSTWTGHPTTTAYTTTTTTTTTSSSTTTTTTTTNGAPTCAPSPTPGSFNNSPSGSCGCAFTVDCNVHAAYTSTTKFWEQTTGQIVGSLEQCVEMCNNNSACEATVWTNSDPSDTQDYMRCWQISGLGGNASAGFGQISRKGQCSGQCSSSYSAPQ